jgi:hypothetical protein
MLRSAVLSGDSTHMARQPLNRLDWLALIVGTPILFLAGAILANLRPVMILMERLLVLLPPLFRSREFQLLVFLCGTILGMALVLLPLYRRLLWRPRLFLLAGYIACGLIWLTIMVPLSFSAVHLLLYFAMLGLGALILLRLGSPLSSSPAFPVVPVPDDPPSR